VGGGGRVRNAMSADFCARPRKLENGVGEPAGGSCAYKGERGRQAERQWPDLVRQNMVWRGVNETGKSHRGVTGSPVMHQKKTGQPKHLVSTGDL